MLNVSANCSPIRPAFGTSERGKRHNINNEVLKDVNNAISSLKDSSVDDEDKAKNFSDLNERLTGELKQSGPLKVVIGAICIGLAGFFLGRKIVGQKALDVVDKNTKLLDFLADKTELMMKKLGEVKPSDEKNLKGLLSRTSAKFLEKLDAFGKNGISAEELEKLGKDPKALKKLISKNIARKGVTNLGGGIGLGVGVKESTDDKNGDLTPDIFQFRNKNSGGTLGTVSTIVDTMDVISDLI